MNTMSLVRMRVVDRVATVTLDHPPVNVLSAKLLEELDDLIDRIEKDRTVRVVILTGAGRVFCAGADIRELRAIATREEGTRRARQGQALLAHLEGLNKPVIAAINGACVGGGLELAMACHLRVAAEGIQLGLPEVTLGLIPGFAGTQRLPRIVGTATATEMILTGRLLTAAEARDIGLLNRLVPPQDLIADVAALARTIAEKGRHAVEAALNAIRASLERPPADGLAREAALFGELFETNDAHEGLQAFLEKRRPVFEPQ